MPIINPITPASIGAVPTSRLVSAGTGMSGGGSLATDITLDAIGGGALTLIQRQLLSGPASDVIFSAIPNSYEDLILMVMGRGTNPSTFVETHFQFNADAGANYDYQQGSTNNALTTSGGAAGQVYGFMGWVPAASGVADQGGSCELLIPSYKRAAFNKSFLARGGLRNGTLAANMFEANFWGDWRSLAPISSIRIFPDAGNWATNSIFSLYGRS